MLGSSKVNWPTTANCAGSIVIESLMSPYTLSESFEVVIAFFWRQHGPAIAVLYYDRLLCRVPVGDATAGKIPGFDSGDLAVKYLVHIARKLLRANPANVMGSISRLRPLGSVICNVIGNLASFRAVVDEDRGCGNSYVEVVVVVAGDGEVPHPAVVDLGRGSAVGGGLDAVRGLEGFALAEFGGRDPLLRRRIPEQVVAGGVDDCCAAACLYPEVVEVGVVVD